MGQQDLTGPDLTDKSRRRRLEDAAARMSRRKTFDADSARTPDEAAIAETWDLLDALRDDPAIQAELRTPYREPLWRAACDHVLAHRGASAVAAGLGLAAVIGLGTLFAAPVVSTGIGEQRLVQLADGSQVTLNTDSRIRVHIDGTHRRIELLRGEAYFDVAKMNGAPFVVVAATSEVRVTGTHFNVHRSDSEGDRTVRVDVLEGRVLAGAHAAETPAGAAVLIADQAVVLDGQGLVRWRGAADEPHVDNWRQGRVYFSNTPLREAVADMNRYTRLRLVITSATVADMPVSGVFRAGASDSFARALGAAYPLSVRSRDNVIEISQKDHTGQ